MITNKPASKEFAAKINEAIKEENARNAGVFKTNSTSKGSPSKTLNGEQLNTLRSIALGEMDNTPMYRAMFFENLGIISSHEAAVIGSKINTIKANSPAVKDDMATADARRKKFFEALKETGVSRDEATRLIAEYFSINTTEGAGKSNTTIGSTEKAGRWDPYARKWKQIGN